MSAINASVPASFGSSEYMDGENDWKVTPFGRVIDMDYVPSQSYLVSCTISCYTHPPCTPTVRHDTCVFSSCASLIHGLGLWPIWSSPSTLRKLITSYIPPWYSSTCHHTFIRYNLRLKCYIRDIYVFVSRSKLFVGGLSWDTTDGI